MRKDLTEKLALHKIVFVFVVVVAMYSAGSAVKQKKMVLILTKHNLKHVWAFKTFEA